MFTTNRFFKIIILLLFITITMPTLTPTASARHPFKVLYINSYEKGYKWSDDIYDGIQSVFTSSGLEISIDIEYLGSHYVESDTYLETLYQLFKLKYEKLNYDLIITSDDVAFTFISEYGDRLFGDIPRLFCGVNHYDEEKIENSSFTSGIIEDQAIQSTIQTALNHFPATKTIYCVNDTSLTGLSIQKELEDAIKIFDQVTFEAFDTEAFMAGQSVPLLENSMLLFLIYTVDSKGTPYHYTEAINRLAKAYEVPIYGQWDFTLGEGIIGGNLTGGFYQGELVAGKALSVLKGNKLTLDDVIINETTRHQYDYIQLVRFDIDASDLPDDSLIINYQGSDALEILVLHSYHQGLVPTDNMQEGLLSSLHSSDKDIHITFEYMDTKNNSSLSYRHKISDFIYGKLSEKQYDLIYSVNDNAFSFMKSYHQELFPGTPLVYLGINQTLADMKDNPPEFTGLLEILDYNSTIRNALSLFPGTKEIIIINDQTTTGASIRQLIDQVIADNDFDVMFTFWDSLNMNELQLQCQSIPEDSIVLLGAFTEDRSGNNFTFAESIELISPNVHVPIFSCWEFYLGDGIIGGNLFNSYEHGILAGEIGLSILDGTSPWDIPVKTDSGNRYMYDYEILQRYEIKLTSLPEDSIIINEPAKLTDYYQKNRTIINTTFVIILIILALALSIIAILLRRTLIIKAQIAEQERQFAMTDMLTGFPNRRAGLKKLDDFIGQHDTFEPLTICFIDLNNLKIINDRFGHLEGDNALKVTSRVCSEHMTSQDFFCRLGGDEFLLILPNTYKDDALLRIKEIRSSLESYNASHDGHPLSISVGITQYEPESHKSLDSLVEEADQLMYKDKKGK